MVKICSNTYPSSNELKYASYFKNFPYELSSFQKWSIQAIVEGQHVLTCAHTGSGKTLPAEFAIMHFCKKKTQQETQQETQQYKKVIYCSPIKALSNQKYHDFCDNPYFKDITIGLITGDIKTNTDASVLIMTTEILLNKLYSKNKPNQTIQNRLDFDLDIENDVACVIFDEVHYINDKDRGEVWEQSIMLMPSHIQLVMLSATLESPETFALWCETKGNDHPNKPNELNEPLKEVYLTTTTERIVPLTHYSFITCSTNIYKQYGKDKAIAQQIGSMIDKLHIIQTPKGEFQEITVDSIKKTLTLFDIKNYRPSRQHVLNQVCKYMTANEMFPAICFVYSRRNVEEMAREIETIILEDDSKVPYLIRTECEQILRTSLVNWREYVCLPEYHFIISLLEKGVAIHHAGMLNVFREMIELMFSRGYVKLLFATETFSVGINMPTKTVLFTGLSKFDGSNIRQLLPHEYNQQSGRAGRRGKDTIGNVIHLTNLWETTKYTNQELKQMLRGTPQRLESKFHISYSLLINLISRGYGNNTHPTHPTITLTNDLIAFTKKTMMQQVIDRQLGAIYSKITGLLNEQENKQKHNTPQYKTPIDTLNLWTSFEKKLTYANNKTKKDIIKQQQTIKTNNPCLEHDLAIYKQELTHTHKINQLKQDYNDIEKCVQNQMNQTLGVLMRKKYIEYESGVGMETETGVEMGIGVGMETGIGVGMGMGTSNIILTNKGHIAHKIHEIHCVGFVDWFLNTHKVGQMHRMSYWSASEIVCFCSIFANITVSDELKSHTIPETIANTDYGKSVNAFKTILEESYDEELREGLQTGMTTLFDINYDLILAMKEWCLCENDANCRLILEKLDVAKRISLGEFVKAILKINNIAAELEQIAEYLGDIGFLETLKLIPALTLKYVCSSKSLYV